MPTPWGPAGPTSTGPQYNKCETPNQSTRGDLRDLEYGFNLRQYSDFFYDFNESQETFVLEVPLHNVTTDEHNILTDANSRGRVKVPRAGRLIAAHLLAEDALATDGTNHLTFTVTNELASGSGTAEMLSTTTGANTTDSDLASAVAIAAKVGRAFTISGTAANLRVAEGDHILVTATVGGTLANQVDLPVMILTFATIDRRLTPRIVRTAGSPLVGPVDDTANGEITAVLSATSEVNVAGWDWGDQVTVPANRAWMFEALVKISTIDTNERVLIGMGSAFNSTLDDITKNAWFSFSASMAPDIQIDDATSDLSTASGFTVTADTYYLFRICKNADGTVDFFIQNETTNENYVGSLTGAAFAVTDLLQPIILVHKGTGTDARSLTCDFMRVVCPRQ